MSVKLFTICPSIVLFATVPLAAQGFDPGCPLPPQLDKLQQPRQIDKVCSISGDAPEPPHILQNRQKNNFCATGSPVTVTRDTFVRLQSAAQAKHVKFGDRNNLPPDRTPLQKIINENGTSIGEGTLVQYVAFITEARFLQERHSSRLEHVSRRRAMPKRKCGNEPPFSAGFMVPPGRDRLS